jgi:hypothetical protein
VFGHFVFRFRVREADDRGMSEYLCPVPFCINHIKSALVRVGDCSNSASMKRCGPIEFIQGESTSWEVRNSLPEDRKTSTI